MIAKEFAGKFSQIIGEQLPMQFIMMRDLITSRDALGKIEQPYGGLNWKASNLRTGCSSF